MIENEFKTMLDEKQYNSIKELYDWDGEINQTNYYYDTENFDLIKKSVTCRIRKIKGEYYLQMKLPNKGEYSRTELEREIDGLPETLSGKLLSELSGMKNLPDVKLIGELSTLRLVKKFAGMEIDLDKSRYFGKTDYELELEFTENEYAAKELFNSLKEKAGIDSNDIICNGKIRRFMREYEKNA